MSFSVSSSTAPSTSGPSPAQQPRRRTPSSSGRPAEEEEADYEDGDAEGEEDDDELEMNEEATKEMFNEQTIKSGYLYKKGEKRKMWKKRWFVLRSSKLAYYKNEKEYQLLRFVDMADVHTVASVELKKNEHAFGIVTPKRTYYVKAGSRSEMESWITALNDVKTQLAQRSTITQVAQPEAGAVPKQSRSQQQEGGQSSSGSGSGARPISISIPGKGAYVQPAQPRPIPGSTAFSPLTATTASESEAGAERFGLSYASSTGQSMGSSPGRGDASQNRFFGGHSPQSNSGGEVSDTPMRASRRGSHTAAGLPRQRSTSGGRRDQSTGSSGGDPNSPTGRGSASYGPMSAVPSSSEDEDDGDWDEGEGADQAMPLPGLVSGPYGGVSGTAADAAGTQDGTGLQAPSHATIPSGSDLLRNPNKVITQGYLMKQSNRRKHWRKRWFVLTSSKLMYTRSHMDAKAHRQIPLTSILDAIEYESRKGSSTALSSTSPALQSPNATGFNLGPFGNSGGEGARDSERNGASGASGVGSSLTANIERGGLGGDEAEAAPRPERRPSMANVAAGVASGVGVGVGGAKKKKENCFKIITPKRTYVVCAPTEDEEIKWLSALQTLVSRQRSAASAANAGSAAGQTKALPVTAGSAVTGATSSNVSNPPTKMSRSLSSASSAGAKTPRGPSDVNPVPATPTQSKGFSPALQSPSVAPPAPGGTSTASTPTTATPRGAIGPMAALGLEDMPRQEDSSQLGSSVGTTGVGASAGQQDSERIARQRAPSESSLHSERTPPAGVVQ